MAFIDRLRGLLPKQPVTTLEPVVYQPIGVVRNHIHASMPSGWENVRSDIVILDALGPALDSLEGFSHVIVVFHLDRVPESEQRLQLPVGTDAAERGVFATRSQLRPNAIGVSVVEVVQRRKNILRVKGLDALDGSPVLDLKPYLPPYDSVPDAQLPAWAVRTE